MGLWGEAAPTPIQPEGSPRTLNPHFRISMPLETGVLCLNISFLVLPVTYCPICGSENGPVALWATCTQRQTPGVSSSCPGASPGKEAKSICPLFPAPSPAPWHVARSEALWGGPWHTHPPTCGWDGSHTCVSRRHTPSLPPLTGRPHRGPCEESSFSSKFSPLSLQSPPPRGQGPTPPPCPRVTDVPFVPTDDVNLLHLCWWRGP